MATTPEVMLRLQRTPGVGPVLARRLLERFGDDAARLFALTPAALERVPGVGPGTSARLAAGLRDAASVVARERERADAIGARFVALGEPGYPALLAELPDAPLALSLRGDPAALDGAPTVAVVGSRRATPYGVEQAERFASVLAGAGLVVVSGGARGIDSAAHRAAIRAGGPTVVVLGCGLGRCYPPENRDLFERVVRGGGLLVSELPIDANPAPENFPARNRIISGLALGVLVVEAPEGSGALITARCALDDHGREVMAVPGRVDSPASAGANALIRRGEAALVASPADVIDALEQPARHQFAGSHGPRYAPATSAGASVPAPAPPAAPPSSLTDEQRAVYDALAQPLAMERLVEASGVGPDAVRAAITVLEIRRLIERRGSAFARRTAR